MNSIATFRAQKHPKNTYLESLVCNAKAECKSVQPTTSS